MRSRTEPGVAVRLSDVTRRTWWLLSDLQDAARSLRPPLSELERQRAVVVLLEISNTWTSFMRRYYLVSAIGGHLQSGARVSGTGVKPTFADALDAAVLLFRPDAVRRPSGWRHRDEPNWLDPVVVSRSLVHLGLSNQAGFTSAMGAGSGSHEPLYTCRNFVAHRNRETAVKVRQLVRGAGILSVADPIELPHLPAVGRPQSLVADWVDELITIVELVPQ